MFITFFSSLFFNFTALLDVLPMWIGVNRSQLTIGISTNDIMVKG